MEFHFTVNKNPVSMSFTTDTIDEGLAILADKKNKIGELFAEYANDLMNSTAVPGGTIAAAGTTDTSKPATRGRGRNKDAANATAPDPIQPAGDIPPTPPQQFNHAGGEDGGIPAAVAPPPPVMPVAPPVVPAAAPVERPADKVIAELQRRATTPEAQAQLLKWLADSGAIVAQATWDEAMQVLGFLDAPKVAPLAKALNVAA